GGRNKPSGTAGCSEWLIYYCNLANKKRSLMSPKSVAKVAIDSLFDNQSVIFPGNMKLVSKVPRFILKKIIARRVSKYKL
ncbi:hypothetical protein, partial [Sporolactobacillus laevolacticus]|uniref:hypothetical protein n=1 Tax=Sporolactobacillus laevolacticus TaxID=33018 RepID=UPI0025B53A34